jgi:hypothetical protein
VGVVVVVVVVVVVIYALIETFKCTINDLT